MDLRKIKKLNRAGGGSGITELQVRSGEEEVRMSRATLPVATQSVATPVEPAPPAAVAAESTQSAQRGDVVASPMAGTSTSLLHRARRRSSRRAPRWPWGDVLCIIESMKMMNHIEAEQAGEVVAVLARDGQPIETGAPLFRIA